MSRTTKPLGIEWEQIETRLNRGMPVRDIAHELGCSPQAIYDRMRRRGLTPGSEGPTAVNGGAEAVGDGC